MLGYIPTYLTRGLFQLIFYPTFRCNARCLTCFNWKNIESAKKDELSIEEINRISKNMPSFPWLMFSGGEPFLRGDLVNIVRLIKSPSETISTNGLMPNRIAGFVEKMLEIRHLKQLGISVSISCRLMRSLIARSIRTKPIRY